MRNVLFILILIFLPLGAGIFGKDKILEDIYPSDYDIYMFKMKNGDVISGYVVELVKHPDFGEGVRVDAELYSTTLYAAFIEEIYLMPNNYRHSHRIFLLPTAEPIGNDHFVGVFELLMLYGGFGIGDIVSVTAGHSMVPGVGFSEQVSILNLKATVYTMHFQSLFATLSFAVGGNMAFVNDQNRFDHIYTMATFSGQKTSVTAGIYYKAGEKNYYRVHVREYLYDFNYENGAFGIGLGIDTKFSSKHDLHFIGELWNSNVQKPSDTGVFLGFRLGNMHFSSDFGIALFTEPFVIPFASFCWVPF